MEVNQRDVDHNDYNDNFLHILESTNELQDIQQLPIQQVCANADVEPFPVQQTENLESCASVDEIPSVAMKFDTEDDLYDFFKKYAYQAGFGITRAGIRKEGDKKYYRIQCAKGGVHVPKSDPKRTKLSSKTDCKAKINVIVHSDGRCIISRVFLDHNHLLSPKKSRFQRCHREMDSYTKRRLELNDVAGISLNKNFHSLVVEAKGYENLSFGERDCRNYLAKVRKLRLGTGDAEALRDYFVRMQRRSPNFFYVIDMDDEGHLQNVFWADARSRAAYKSFGDVMSFDSTYLTNKYSMPFAPFVGVNHHGQSILLGWALISREDAETYTWLFKSWLECMDGCPPNAIITDQCRSMQLAVARVFPNSHHRLCLWHIMKKIPEKLSGYSLYKEIKRILKILVYESVESQEFEDGWYKMVEDYSLQNNEWLCSLFNDRTRWVPVYVKIIFWAGMSTTQRSESMNAFFDGYVNSKTSLRQFVEQYDNALKSKMEKENKADFESFNSSYRLITRFQFEKQFHEAYTNAIFKLFQDELRGMLFCNFSLVKTDGTQSEFHVTDIVDRKYGESKRRVVYNVSYNTTECDIKCSCHLFEFRGIVCRHMVKILIEKDVREIPLRYILTRWRKDVKHQHHYVTYCYDDLKIGEQAKKFDELCSNFYEVAHIANSSEKYEYLMKCINMAKEKIKDDLNRVVHQVSDSTGKLLPPLQVRSKGRPPSKRKESKIEKIVKNKKKKINASEVQRSNSLSNVNVDQVQGSIALKDNSSIPKCNFDLNE